MSEIEVKRYTYDSDNEHMEPELFGEVEMVLASAHDAALSAANATIDSLRSALANSFCDLREEVLRLTRELEEVREALGSIRIYAADTLSGPTDEYADMADWYRSGVRELLHRARAALPGVSP